MLFITITLNYIFISGRAICLSLLFLYRFNLRCVGFYSYIFRLGLLLSSSEKLFVICIGSLREYVD